MFRTKIISVNPCYLQNSMIPRAKFFGMDNFLVEDWITCFFARALNTTNKLRVLISKFLTVITVANFCLGSARKSDKLTIFCQTMQVNFYERSKDCNARNLIIKHASEL